MFSARTDIIRIFFGCILNFLDKKINAFGAQYKAFGLFGVVNYSTSYFLLYYFGTTESGILRLIAFSLCVPLIFTPYWPDKIKKYLNLYWFLTLLYCLPFFGTYMLLKNHVSLEWLMNIPTGLFLLILLVDWVLFVILLFGGIALGCLAFLLTGQEMVIQSSFSEVGLAGYIYIYAIMIGIIFARNHERAHQEKLQAMKMLSGTIAHELRTPLAAITSIGNALARILPFYQEGYERAKATSLLERAVEKKDEAYLADIPQSLRTLSQNANITINMLLANLSENLGERKLEPCSIVTCVKEAIETYPFSPIQRPLVHWQDSGKWQNNIPQDFSFLGHKELLKHVLFNLFKNALYAIAAAGKGEIFITIEPAEKKGDKKFSRLIFKDTGPGMPPQVLRHIFDRFYTKTEHGTGIGLAFCQNVMHGFGGEIACTSQHGEYTTFTLSFPVIKEKA